MCKNRVRFVFNMLFLLVFCLNFGCAGDEYLDDSKNADGDTESAEDVENSEVGENTGDFSLVFDSGASVFSLKNGDKVLATIAKEGFLLGKVAKISDDVNYDPYPLVTEDPMYTAPKGLQWLTANLIKDNGDSTYDLTFTDETKAKLTFSKNSDGSFKFMMDPADDSKNLAYYRIKIQADKEEGYYGLGEWEDVVNHRGIIRAMQLEMSGLSESGYNEAHIPIPFVIGTTGWGVFANCPYPGLFNVAKTKEDTIDFIFGPGLKTIDGIEFHMFAADHPLDITKHYYELTGYPVLPAKWALGPWIWRDELPDHEEFAQQKKAMEDLKTIRDLDLATSGYWIDRPYASGVNGFDFNPQQFNDAQAMIDHANDNGFRVALWHTPYMSNGKESTDITKAYFKEATDKGYFPPTPGLNLNNWSNPIDFTNPEAYKWWQSLIKKYIDMGIEGFKLDYGEDIVPGIGGARSVWKFHDGSDERTMHSQYQLLYHKVYAEMLPEDGGFLICRAGTYGDQKHVSVVWPGDLDATMHKHGDLLEEGSKALAVGGMPASMICGLTLGPAGFPFYGADTGGYRHTPPDKETFVRWFEQTALSTVMQVGTNANNVPWEEFDADVLEWYRIYARLHMRLFPYEWTYAKNIANDGRAIQRSLGLAYPEIGKHPWDTYLFGDDLLVAPVVEHSARKRDVIFPTGNWVDWWNGKVTKGEDKKISVDAPLDKLPLYLKEGGIIPMLRPTIDTTAPVKDGIDLESYANDPGILYVRIFAGAKSSFELYDKSAISQEKTDTSISLTSKDGEEFKKGVVFELVAFGANIPKSVKNSDSDLAEVQSMNDLESAKDGWFFDSENNGTLFVKVQAGDNSVEVGL